MNNQPRKVVQIIEPQTVMEGAGVRLKRSIATATLDHLDPFLLFDHFGSDNPDDYSKGFPMHPHRGIETVTYMINGHVNHKDSIGNSGSIGSGDIQWKKSTPYLPMFLKAGDFLEPMKMLSKVLFPNQVL